MTETLVSAPDSDSDSAGRVTSARTDPSRPQDAWLGRMKPAFPLALVLSVYALAALLVVPTLADTAVGDDWVYAREAKLLLTEGSLQILEPAAAISVFEAVWGAAVGWLFGLTFGVLRASTVVLSAAGCIGIYGASRALRVSRVVAAVAAATYLFNPVQYVISFTYMTDPHFSAFLSLALWGYLTGVSREPIDTRSTILGSVAAALAFLCRHQGLLIPAAVVAYLLLARRLRFDRASVGMFAAVVGIPVMTVGAYFTWVTFFRGVPAAQADFLGNIGEAGPGGVTVLLRRHGVIQPTYIGFFLAPVAAAGGCCAWRWLRHLSARSVLLAAVVLVALGSGWRSFMMSPRRMPYLRSYWSPLGLGPYDIALQPGPVASERVFDLITYACIAATVVLVVVAAAAFGRRWERRGPGLVVVVLLVMGIGALFPSVLFREAYVGAANVPGLDRYLLPLLPPAAILGAWCMARLRIGAAPAIVVLVAMGAFAVAGTRDHLVFQREVWDMARHANSLGIPNTKLDAGAAWDGEYLWAYSVENQIPVQTPNGAWWTYTFAPATDSSYVVGAGIIPGATVVAEKPYSRWLDRSATVMYLQRRPGVEGTP